MHIVIRADGGPDIGYGHLIRTGALAAKFLSCGHEVTYATVTPEYVDEACPEGVITTELESRTDPSELVEVVREGVDITVIDSYKADSEYQRVVRGETPLVLVADDTRHAVCADIVVNGNLYAEGLEYDVLGAVPTWCLGPDYVLLRESVTRLVAQKPQWRDPPEQALVTMGGSDIANLTPEVIRAFDGVPVSLDVVLGPGFSNEDEIRSTLNAVDVKTQLIRDPPNLPELMFEADFAVSTCGTTIYELLALGTPFVCCPVVENQALLANELEDQDLGIVIDGELRAKEIRRGINNYVLDPEVRRLQRRNGRSLVDGRGTDRLCEVITDLTGVNSVK